MAEIRADEIASRLEHLIGSSRRRRLVSVTVEMEGVDPAALAFASRRASDRWFAWEEPDRDFALAGVGEVAEVISRGPERFRDVARDAARILENRSSDEPAGLPAGAGPVWCGGFAFDPDGGGSAKWSSLPPALMALPELSACRVEGRTYVTACALPDSGTAPGEAASSLVSRLGSFSAASLPMLDPLGERVEVRSALDPLRYAQSVAGAVARIRAGELEKVVLAREVLAEAQRAHDPAAIFGAMRELFPSCFCFCVGSPEAAFIGASPELLVRRRGAGAQTVALAGSTRRSADPAVDDHLGEQLRQSPKNRIEHDIVVRRIERALKRHAIWVGKSDEAELVKVANIQHLATPIHAQLAEPRSAVELAGLLHPTPAVGGEPSDQATALIRELEDLDRGWYAGPVGWMDSAWDGDFCVALRSALLRDRTAHLFAGAGIVGDSEPESELAETELKLDALLPLVSG